MAPFGVPREKVNSENRQNLAPTDTPRREPGGSDHNPTALTKRTRFWEEGAGSGVVAFRSSGGLPSSAARATDVAIERTATMYLIGSTYDRLRNGDSSSDTQRTKNASSASADSVSK